MSHSPNDPSTTQVSAVVNAPREAVYRAFLDPVAVASWLPPESMTGDIHAFEPWVGGELRMTLRYQGPDHALPGKTTADSDRFQGRFVELVLNQKVVWATMFDSPDPRFSGEMRISFTLSDTVLAGNPAATEVVVLCENIPPGIRPEENAEGCRSTLANLARFVEFNRPAQAP